MHSAPGAHISVAGRKFFLPDVCTFFNQFIIIAVIHWRSAQERSRVHSFPRGSQNKALISNTGPLVHHTAYIPMAPKSGHVTLSAQELYLIEMDRTSFDHTDQWSHIELIGSKRESSLSTKYKLSVKEGKRVAKMHPKL